MNVFTFPLETAEDKEKIIKLINELAEMVKAAVTVKDQLCITTNSTRLSLILDQLACDDPEKPMQIERTIRRRGGIRKGKPGPVNPENASSDNRD